MNSNTLAYSLTTSLGIRSTYLTDLLLIATGCLFTSLMAQIVIPLTPVPITGQTLAVLLIGASYGRSRAALSMALYIILGAIGLPVFAGQSSGVHILSGPTSGYLFGFIVCGWVMGKLAEDNFGKTLTSALILFLIGNGIIFTCGVSWLAYQIGWTQAIQYGLVPFIPGALIKLSLATILIRSAWRGITRFDASSGNRAQD